MNDSYVIKMLNTLQEDSRYKITNNSVYDTYSGQFVNLRKNDYALEEIYEYMKAGGML